MISSNLRALISLTVLLWISGLISCGQVTAQDSLNVFNHIASSNAFSLNPITAIAQDDHGLMWFASRQGLLRYDGVELEKFSIDKPDTMFTDPNDVLDLGVSSDGEIWVATYAGVYRYDPVRDVFTSLEDLLNYQPASLINLSNCILVTPDDLIWVGTNNGIWMYDPGQNVVQKITSGIGATYCLRASSNGGVWAGNNNEILNILPVTGGSDSVKIISYQLPAATGPVQALLPAGPQSFLVGTSQGLWYFDGVEKNFTPPAPRFARLPQDVLIRTMLTDGQDRLWIGTFEGIYVVEPDGRTSFLQHNPRDDSSLSGDKIRSLFLDKDKSVWVGTYYGGINLWNEELLRFSRIDEGSGNQLHHKVVSSIQEDENGNIYYGTEGGGVTIYNAADGTYQQRNTLRNTGETIGTVKTMLLTDPEHLWIGTFAEGLIDYNPVTGEGSQFKQEPANPESLGRNGVLALAISDERSLWVGMIDGGLDRLDRQTGKFTHYLPLDTLNNSKSRRGPIRAMHYARSGNLYLGTSQVIRVLRADEARNGLAAIRDLPVRAPGPASISVTDIHEDSRGRLWAGTLQSGLFRISDNEVIPQAIPGVKDVYAITEEKNTGVLWLSTSEGVVRYAVGENAPVLFQQADGVEINEFSRAAGLASRSGNLYFGGATGVTVVRPDKIRSEQGAVNDVLITGFRLFEDPISVHDSSGFLSKRIEFTEAISLAYDQNIFRIRFASPQYLSTRKTTYAYRLVGLDENWTHTNQNEAAYAIQRGGNYRFEVKAILPDGTSSAVTSLRVNVAHPPWRTWWAYLLYATGILATIYLLVSSNASRIRLRHELETEARELERLQEVNDQKLRFFTNISHEFRTPLTLISGSMERALEGYKGSSKLYRHLLVIRKSTDQMYRLINELLDFRKLENQQTQLRAAEGNIVRFANEIFLSFQARAKARKMKYTFSAVADELSLFYDRDKLEKVLYNLLSNAFRHTPNEGSVEVRVEQRAGFVDLVVRDTGQGIPPGEVERIFERFYTLPNRPIHDAAHQGTGIGLAIAKHVTELHRGTLAVTSMEGEGSTFTVSLPVGNSHLSEGEIIGEFRNSEDITGYEMPTELPEETTTSIMAVQATEREDLPLILVTEDNQEVAEFIHSVLVPTYRVTLAANGREGYERAIAEQPDLILSDLMMPELDGIGFCEKVKSDVRTSHIPFILLTARTSLVYKYDGLESGADDYLSKPFRVRELLLKCGNILATRRSLREKVAGDDVLPAAGIPLNSLDEEMLKNALAMVRENLGNPDFKVDQFCERLGLSRSLLFTKFKAWTGQTPNDFILQERMRSAASLLESGKFNVSEISYRVGYKDPGYFTKSFRKYHGMTPREYSRKFAS